MTREKRRSKKSGRDYFVPLLFLGIWIGLFFLGWIAIHVSMKAATVPAVVKRVEHLALRQSNPLLQSLPSSSLPLVLLSKPNRGARAFADVRGNLGPVSVVLENRTADWLKDRWQAASDMHGTAIKGQHWVHVHMGRPVRVHAFLLDWETASAEDYRLEGWLGNQSVVTFFDAERAEDVPRRRSHSFGQSPGVKQKLPLHIIHEIDCPTNMATTVDEVRLVIRKPFHPSWGVSLWRFQSFGNEVS